MDFKIMDNWKSGCGSCKTVMNFSSFNSTEPFVQTIECEKHTAQETSCDVVVQNGAGNNKTIECFEHLME